MHGIVIGEGYAYQGSAIGPFHRVNSKRGNGDVAGVRSNRWNGAKRHIAGAIIYLRNVFIEYYAAQVGNLVHGYAINERRSERDTGRGGGGRPRERLEVRGGDARGRGGIAGAETIIRGGVRGGGSRGKEREALDEEEGRETKRRRGGEELVGGGESRARVQEKERTTEGGYSAIGGRGGEVRGEKERYEGREG